MSGPVPGTPTPWKVAQNIGKDATNIYPDTGRHEFAIAVKPEFIRDECWRANVAAIVHRMNNWDAEQAKIAALVEALGETHDWIKAWSPRFTDDEEWPDTESKIESALALAKGEAQ